MNPTLYSHIPKLSMALLCTPIPKPKLCSGPNLYPDHHLQLSYLLAQRQLLWAPPRQLIVLIIVSIRQAQVGGYDAFCILLGELYEVI